MSGKFGLGDEVDDVTDRVGGKLDLSGFAPVQRRSPIDLAEVDAAAAPHGFVSREASPVMAESAMPGRRRRAVAAQPARHLAVRMVQSQYNRFVGYADRYSLTYQDAIMKLLDDAGE